MTEKVWDGGADAPVAPVNVRLVGLNVRGPDAAVTFRVTLTVCAEDEVLKEIEPLHCVPAEIPD